MALGALPGCSKVTACEHERSGVAWVVLQPVTTLLEQLAKLGPPLDLCYQIVHGWLMSMRISLNVLSILEDMADSPAPDAWHGCPSALCASSLALAELYT